MFYNWLHSSTSLNTLFQRGRKKLVPTDRTRSITKCCSIYFNNSKVAVSFEIFNQFFRIFPSKDGRHLLPVFPKHHPRYLSWPIHPYLGGQFIIVGNKSDIGACEGSKFSSFTIVGSRLSTGTPRWHVLAWGDGINNTQIRPNTRQFLRRHTIPTYFFF